MWLWMLYCSLRYSAAGSWECSHCSVFSCSLAIILVHWVWCHRFQRCCVRGHFPPLQVFFAIQKLSCERIFVRKFGVETPIFVEFRGKIEIFSLHSFLCQKFFTVCKKICCSAFLNPRRCWLLCLCSLVAQSYAHCIRVFWNKLLPVVLILALVYVCFILWLGLTHDSGFNGDVWFD